MIIGHIMIMFTVMNMTKLRLRQRNDEHPLILMVRHINQSSKKPRLKKQYKNMHVNSDNLPFVIDAKRSFN